MGGFAILWTEADAIELEQARVTDRVDAEAINEVAEARGDKSLTRGVRPKMFDRADMCIVPPAQSVCARPKPVDVCVLHAHREDIEEYNS